MLGDCHGPSGLFIDQQRLAGASATVDFSRYCNFYLVFREIFVETIVADLLVTTARTFLEQPSCRIDFGCCTGFSLSGW